MYRGRMTNCIFFGDYRKKKNYQRNRTQVCTVNYVIIMSRAMKKRLNSLEVFSNKSGTFCDIE